MSEHLAEYVQGYVDALKDNGEWHEMTKAQQREVVSWALVYFDKIDYGITQARIAVLNLLNPNWVNELN
jgi:hypothetical protein